jgi:glycosyltransferase involved in cell wall biosynthesis
MTTSNNLKILYITRSAGSVGGMERLAEEYIAALQKRDDIELTVIAHRGSRYLLPLFLLTACARALIAARRADIIHLGDPLLAKIGWFIKKIHSKPVAITIHGLDVTYANPLYQLYLRLFFRHLDAYFPISKFTKSLLEKYHLRGHVQVITPGIVDRLYQPQELQPNILFTAGRLVKRKGHAWFITHVLPHLSAEIKYSIAGDGPERENILRAAREVNVADRVQLLGRVSEEKLRELYNSAAAFVQPNILVAGDCEGFGLVLLEAALCERAVFASRLEGITDAIHEGKNGILLPAENAQAWITALTEYLHNPTSQPHARQYTLQAFSWPIRAEEYINAFRHLTKEQK